MTNLSSPKCVKLGDRVAQRVSSRPTVFIPLGELKPLMSDFFHNPNSFDEGPPPQLEQGISYEPHVSSTGKSLRDQLTVSQVAASVAHIDTLAPVATGTRYPGLDGYMLRLWVSAVKTDPDMPVMTQPRLKRAIKALITELGKHL